LVFDAASQRLNLANGSGAAPALATRDRYGDGIPDDGPLSITIPGALSAWAEVSERFGTRPLPKLLDAAVDYAENGFPAYDSLIANIRNSSARLRKYTAGAHPFLSGDAPPKPSDIIRQPELAATLKRVCRNGPRELYALETAGELERAIRKQGGLVSAADLA